MTQIGMAGLLVRSPRRFFEELAANPRFALPMWLSIGLTLALLVWYYAVVDFPWLVDRTLAASPQTAQMSEQQRESAAAFLTPQFMMASSLVAGTAFALLLRALEALWYRLAGRAVGLARSFRQWFAFAWWTSLPHLLGVVPAVLLLAFPGSGQMDAGALQPFSVNELFLHLAPGERGYSLWTQVGPLNVLAIGLAAFGVRCWSGSWGRALGLTVLPALLLLGAGAGLVIFGPQAAGAAS